MRCKVVIIGYVDLGQRDIKLMREADAANVFDTLRVRGSDVEVKVLEPKEFDPRATVRTERRNAKKAAPIVPANVEETEGQGEGQGEGEATGTGNGGEQETEQP